MTAAEQVAKARHLKKQEGLAIKVANVAAGALATLAKNNDCNQIMITEEGGIQPLVDLLKTPSDSYESPTKALWHLAATEDNQSAIAVAHSDMINSRSRHIARRYFKVRELLHGTPDDPASIVVRYIESAANVADAFTKAVDVDTLVRHRDAMLQLRVDYRG